jgi:phosphatidylglycerol:prolipoprotein diacylglycerol transferase
MEFEDMILFSVFGRPVTAYALCLAAALGAGLFLFFAAGKKRRIPGDTLWRAALLALPLGLLCARAFYCIVRVYYFLEVGLDAMLRFWDGGYALWGAVGGSALAMGITAKTKKEPAAPLMDAAAIAGSLIIGLMRFAEYFSGEGRGFYLENEAFCFFPVAVFRADYEEWHLAVFLWEGLIALMILAALLRRERRAGKTAQLFLILYGASQILMESLRQDNTLRWLFVRVSQLTAALVIAGFLIFAVIRWSRNPDRRKMSGAQLVLCWAVVLLSVGACIAMEFSVEGKIFVTLPIWTAYVIMALACVCIGTAAYRATFHSVKEEAFLKV